MWFYSSLETFVCQFFLEEIFFFFITDNDRIDSLTLICGLQIKASQFSMPESSIFNVNLLAF